MSIAVHDDVEGRSESTDDSGVYLFRGLRVGLFRVPLGPLDGIDPANDGRAVSTKWPPMRCRWPAFNR